MHLDGGVNRSVTDDIRLLHNVRNIPEYVMHGAQKDGPIINCNKVGYLKLMCRGRGVLNVKTYYSPDVSETILSPGDITKSNDNNFTLWEQYSNLEDKIGHIRFSSKSGLQSATVDTRMINGLWYATQPFLDCLQPGYDDGYDTPDTTTPILRRMSKAAVHELWHQRLCHPGHTVTSTISKTAEGVPNLTHGRNAFYKCDACMRAKIESTAKTSSSPTRDSPISGPGQMFNMDFGFVRGSDFKRKGDDGRIITSRDGYNSYLIIIDRYSSYTWVMLSRSKDPPLNFVKDFLMTHKDKKCPIIRVRTDQGGELWKSTAFQEVIQESQSILEPTGAGDPAQNGKAEAPNKTFARMLRGMLFNAGLGSEFWSYALLHAVYIKNRLPHSSLHMKRSPYEAYTGIKPNLSMLRVWGCRVIVKQPNKRDAKLDDNTTQGIFLRFTATDKNIVYLDLATNNEKISSNVTFDEAHFSTGSPTPGSKALRNSGINGDVNSTQLEHNNKKKANTIRVKRIHDTNAKLPKRSNKDAAGMDLFTPEDFEIDGNCRKMIPIGIAMSLPDGVYGRIAPRSGITIKKNIDVRASVVDRDFRGEITVVLQNVGKEKQSFKSGDRIAQMILEQCKDDEVHEWTMKLDDTERGEKGFGSTDPVIRQINSPHPEYDNIVMSTNPYGPSLTVQYKVKGNHDTLGMEIDDTSMVNRLTLLNCLKGTPTARIPKWRSQLRGAQLVKIDNIELQSIADVIRTIREFKENRSDKKMSVIDLEFVSIEKVAMHPQKGIPQMYFDQLNVVANHHLELVEEAETILQHDEYKCEINEGWKSQITKLSNESSPENTVKQKDSKVVEKLTRRILMKRDDWNDWKQSERKQLE